MCSGTSWIELNQGKCDYAILEKNGVYCIRMVGPNGKPIPIPRIAGKDCSGLIYIGRSGLSTSKTKRTIAERLREFQNKKHSGGRAYDDLKAILERCCRYKNHRLQAQSRFMSDCKIHDCEAKLINKYYKEFGELPPCNSKKERTAIE